MVSNMKKNKVIKFCAVIFIIFFIMGSVPVINAEDDNLYPDINEDTEYYAVFFGLAKYDSYWYDCGYADVDAKNLYEFLKAHDNWKEENMKLFINEEVTLDNITKGIQWLANVSDENDVVLFYYAGHGTKHETVEHSCISTYYMIGTSDKANTTSDIELAKDFDKIKSKNIVLIFDCCWSARQTSLMVDGRVHISAGGKYFSCVVDWDEDLEDGFLTYYFCKGLQGPADKKGNNDGIISAEELFSYARPRIAIRSFLFHIVMLKNIREYGRLLACFPWSQISHISDKKEGEIPLVFL